jgi:hypothetical protein
MAPPAFGPWGGVFSVALTLVPPVRLKDSSFFSLKLSFLQLIDYQSEERQQDRVRTQEMQKVCFYSSSIRKFRVVFMVVLLRKFDLFDYQLMLLNRFGVVFVKKSLF